MFCTKCGARNTDEAIYCQKCGTLLEAEEQTRIARPVRNEKIEKSGRIQISNLDKAEEAEELEKQIFSIHPTLTFVKIGYGLAAFGGLLLVALLASLYNVLKIPVQYSILAALSLLLIPAFHHLKCKLVHYTLTASKVEIDEGFISTTTRNVPLRTIQDVTVSATVWQRMLGFGNLIIENAGETESKIILRNINSPKEHADILLKQMRQLNK